MTETQPLPQGPCHQGGALCVVSQDGYWSEPERLSQQLREGGAHSGWGDQKELQEEGRRGGGLSEGPLALRC